MKAHTHSVRVTLNSQPVLKPYLIRQVLITLTNISGSYSADSGVGLSSFSQDKLINKGHVGIHRGHFRLLNHKHITATIEREYFSTVKR